MDQISNLPKFILHDILSRLPEKDAARTSVLSKAWRDTWSTFPILSFCDTKITGTSPQETEDFLMKRENFLDYVKRTLLRFHDLRMAIKEFKLSVNCFDLEYMSHHIDLWMKLASESGVEALELCLPAADHHESYRLPPCVLEARSLDKLVLMGGIRVDTVFMNHSIQFSSLRVLSFCLLVLEDEQAISNFISSCPLLEYITLKCCSVLNSCSRGVPEFRTSYLKSLSILGLQKLKGVDIQGVQEIDVDAPSLENLCYCPSDMHAPCKMNLDGCRNLRGLYIWSLKSTIITDQWFLELFRKFPLLESLKLVNCTTAERINISSVRLKILELTNCSNLKEVNIDAPNLLSCEYCGGGGVPKPVITFLNSSAQLEVNVLIHIDFDDLCNLREFLQNFKPLSVLARLSLFLHQPIGQFNPDALQVLSPPPRIKRLDLRAVLGNESFYMAVVNSLLWCCCPEIITMNMHSFFCSRAFLEFFYKMLMGQKEVDCYCRSGHTKCWWHGLKDVKVTSSIKTDENVDFKTMLDVLPTSAAGENVSFRLEW